MFFVRKSEKAGVSGGKKGHFLQKVGTLAEFCAQIWGVFAENWEKVKEIGRQSVTGDRWMS